MSQHDEAQKHTADALHISLDVADCMGGYARMLSRILTRHYDVHLYRTKLTLTQFNLLVKIASSPGIIAKTLEQEDRIEKSTMSRTLRRLTDRNLIRAEASNGRQGRRLFLTDEGARMLQSAYPRWKEAQDEALKVLGSSFLEELTACAEKAEAL